MGQPRPSVNPLTHSVGLNTRLVTIVAVTADTAICADRTGVEVRVPLLFQRAKGLLPSPGENWLISQDFGQWAFQAFLGSSSADFVEETLAHGAVIAALPPGNPAPGDIWINNSTGVWNIWNGNQWVPTTAAGGAVISAAPPASPTVGMLWVNSSQGNIISIWDGSQWDPAPFGSGALVEGAIVAGLIAAGAIDGQVINGVTINGGQITGSNFITSGTSGAYFVYSSGGLITSTFTTPGSASWTAPAGVTSVTAECWGGGGGGGSGLAIVPFTPVFGGFSTSASATTVAAPCPAGVKTGHLLVIYMASTTTPLTFSCPGFTAVTVAAGLNCSAQLLYKTAVSSDVTLSSGGGSYTVTCSASHAMAGIIADLGLGSFDPVPAGSGQLAGASGTSFSPVTGPVTSVNGDLLVFFGASREAAPPAASVSAAGYASVTGAGLSGGQVNSKNASGACIGVYAATAVQAAAGKVPDATVTWNVSSVGGGLLIAVTRPGGGAGGVSRTRHVGAALGNSATNGDTTAAQFTGVTGAGRLKALYAFLQSVPAGISSAGNVAPGLALASAAGSYRVYIDFELTHYGISGTYGSGGVPAAGAVTDNSKLDSFISDCLAHGLDLRVVLWHEPYDKFNVYGSQVSNNLDYSNSMGYYGATLRKYGLPVLFNPSNYSADHHWAQVIGNSGSPGLGWAACSAGYIDEVYSDFYVNEGNSGSTPAGSGIQGTLDNVAALADAFTLPLGLLEYGFAPAANTVNWNETDVQAFESYTKSFFQNRLSAGKPICDILSWATNDNATQAGMYLATRWSAASVMNYQWFFDTLDGGTYGGAGGGGTGTGPGGGGGAGEYAKDILAVTPGNSYSYTVGAAGLTGSSGTASAFHGDVGNVTGNPGSGGLQGVPGTAGSGSSAATHFPGGAGAAPQPALSQSVTLSAPGSGTWIVPQGVTSIKIECWGGGAGGGGQSQPMPLQGSGAAGGGGGAYARVNAFTVIPGQSYPYTVGAGGAGADATGQNNANGIASNFNNGTCVAVPGRKYNPNINSAPGGLASGCTGDVRFSGGNGGLMSVAGGGGGGSAGSGSNGNNGQNAGPGGPGNGGPSVLGGGGGGNGGNFDKAGGNGGAPGGGGGGGGSTAGSGNGAAGQIIITYVVTSGGGGGGSGGTAAAGKTATSASGAVAVAGGGPGGAGSSSGTGGVPVARPGGGGGGGQTGFTGGTGSPGQVRITYQSGAPVLSGSIAGAAGTDPFAGTAYPEGAKFDNLVITTAATVNNLTMTGTSSAPSLSVTGALSAGSLTVTGQVTETGGTQASPTLIKTDSWHSLGALGAHYTVTIGRFRLTTDNCVELDIKVVGDGSQATQVTFANTLPAVCIPVTQHDSLPMGTTRQVTAGDIWPRLTVDTSGNVTVINQGTANTFACCVRVPLD